MMLLANKKLLGSLVLISLPVMFWHTTEAASVAERYAQPNVLVQAQRAVDKKQPAHALSLLDSRINKLRDSDDQAQAYALICQARYQQQDYAGAEKACDIAVKTGRPSWSHFNNRGVMRFMLGHYQAALADFHHAAAIKVSASQNQSRSIRRNIASAQRRLASR